MHRWRATDPAGKRWELWRETDCGTLRMVGRVLVTGLPPERRFSAGFFTYHRESRDWHHRALPQGWRELPARSLRVAALLLLSRTKKKPPLHRRAVSTRGGGEGASRRGARAI